MEAYTRCARNSNEDGYCTQHLKKIKSGGKIPIFKDIKRNGVLANESHSYFKNFLKKRIAITVQSKPPPNIPAPIRQIFNDKSGDEWVLNAQKELIKIAKEAIDESTRAMPIVCIIDESDEEDKISEIEKEINEGYITNKKDSIRKQMIKNPDIQQITAKNGITYFLDKNVFDIFDKDQNKIGELKIVSDKYKKKSSIIYYNEQEGKNCNAIIAVKEDYDGKNYYRCIVNNYVYDLSSHKHVGSIKDNKFIKK